MSFLTEDPDTVNIINMETEGEFTGNEIKQILANIRKSIENSPRAEWRPRMWGVQPDGYFPHNPEASNIPVDDYKWAQRYDHPKD